MKAVKLLPVAAVASLAFVTLAPHAQTSAPQKIGFVNVDAVYNAHPSWATFQKARTDAAAKLKPTEDQIRTLQAKGTNISAQERQNLDTLVKTYQTTQQQLTDDINKRLEPIDADVNKAIAAAAKAQGFTVVMNRAVAASSQLVIYADEQTTDFTQAVVNQIKK